MLLLPPPSPKDDWYKDGWGISGWVLESSSLVVRLIPDLQVVPAIKDEEDSDRLVKRREEGVDGPVEMSNDMALTRVKKSER